MIRAVQLHITFSCSEKAAYIIKVYRNTQICILGHFNTPPICMYLVCMLLNSACYMLWHSVRCIHTCV